MEEESQLPISSPSSPSPSSSIISITTTLPNASSSSLHLHPPRGWLVTFVLAYRTLGVVYGGIATSPLYVYPSMDMTKATEGDFLGIFSIIFWTLTIIGVVKYAMIILQADDDGEGGTFALYSLLCKQGDIGNICSMKMKQGRASMRKVYLTRVLEKSKSAQTILFLVALLGSVMLIADGVLTPAISVLSAMAGLRNVAPGSINQDIIVALSAVILVVLFLFQRYGTEGVSALFSPIMIVWLLTNAGIGIYNLCLYYPTIWKAVSPSYAASFFFRHGTHGWISLAGTVLCISGVEAMYADLGHFDKRSLQIGFLLGVYPSNVITYAGQTAYFIRNQGECDEHAFYNSTPRALLWPVLVLSTCSAIVASQSLISACFSLIKQSVELDQFPRVRLIHTSKKHYGQVYSPQINYLLMVLCLLVLLTFKNGAALGNAYGATIITVMFITSLLFSLVLLVVWETSLPLTFSYLGFFGIVEGAYLLAVLTGLPRGGWLPFLVAFLVALIMCSWIYCRKKKHGYEASHQMKPESLAMALSSSSSPSHAINRVPGVCIFYINNPNNIPPYISHYLKHIRTLHQVTILVHVRYVHAAVVRDKERFYFSNVNGAYGVYTCIAKFGFAEPKEVINWGKVSDKIVEDLESHLCTFLQSNTDIQQELDNIQVAKIHTTSVMVGRTRMIAKEGTDWTSPLKRFVIHKIYGFLQQNCPASSLFSSQPPLGLVEIGVNYNV